MITMASGILPTEAGSLHQSLAQDQVCPRRETTSQPYAATTVHHFKGARGDIPHCEALVSECVSSVAGQAASRGGFTYKVCRALGMILHHHAGL